MYVVGKYHGTSRISQMTPLKIKPTIYLWSLCLIVYSGLRAPIHHFWCLLGVEEQPQQPIS